MTSLYSNVAKTPRLTMLNALLYSNHVEVARVRDICTLATSAGYTLPTVWFNSNELRGLPKSLGVVTYRTDHTRSSAITTWFFRTEDEHAGFYLARSLVHEQPYV